MNATPDELPEIELSLDDLVLDDAAPDAEVKADVPSEAPAEEEAPAEPEDRLADVPPLTAERLPPQFRRHVDPASPAPIRGMAARGLVPLNPSDMAHCLAMLTFDADPKISASARESISRLPGKILSVALRDDSLNPRVLDVLCENLNPDSPDMEALILNPSVHDLTLASLVARTRTEKFIEIIAGNQLRLLREEKLLRALLSNPKLPRAVSDSVCDFAVRSGVVLYDLTQFEAAYQRVYNKPLPRPDSAEAAAVKGESAEDLMKELDALVEEEAKEAAQGPAKTGRPKPTGDRDENGKRLSLTQRILNMSMSERIKLASVGSMEARTILLRDPNRMIQSAVINSPKISDNEVLSLAQSKNTGDEVLRTIMNKREWTRQYQVRMALIRNPKTPAQTTIRFLGTLRESDLKKLAKDKNVPSAVQAAAKKMTAPKAPPKGKG